jgi:hypothetical protein
MQIANTILSQLGGHRFIAMTGAKNLLGGDNNLSFKIGRNACKVTHVRITLTPADLYDVEFFAIRGTHARKTLATVEGIYADQLAEVFIDHTGMAVAL